MQRLTIRERATGATITGPETAAAACRDIADADQEVMLLIGLNTRHREIFREIVFRGGVDSAIVDQRIIYRRVLMAGAIGFILAHNHPSGDPTPSIEDRAIARQIREGAKMIGLQMVDFLVIGEDGRYTSIQD